MILQLIQMNEWLAGILLTSFIGLITWIFVRSIHSQDKLTESVASLQITLEGLKRMMDGYTEDREVTKREWSARHEGMNEWLNEHENAIKDHSQRITIVETTLKLDK